MLSCAGIPRTPPCRASAGWVPQFWPDLVGVIPWHYSECFGNDGIGFVKTLRLLRLLKLLRLSHVHRLLQVLLLPASCDAVVWLGAIRSRRVPCLLTNVELKFTRNITLARWQSLYFKFPHAVFMIKCAQLVGTLVLIAHWLGCFWFYVGYAEDGWVHVVGLIDDDLIPVKPGNDSMEWVTALYWAITTVRGMPPATLLPPLLVQIYLLLR